jgi:HSP20 family molecular chaperone IbpA
MYFPFSNYTYCYDVPYANIADPTVESFEKDGRSIVLINALGVDGNDIKIKAYLAMDNSEIISIVGNTKNNMFNKDFKLDITFTTKKPIEEILWDVKNGFLTLDVKFQEPISQAVKITRK